MESLWLIDFFDSAAPCRQSRRGYYCEHAGAILQDTTWHSADQHIVVGDVTVYPQVTLTIEPGATIRFAPRSDSTGGGNDATRSELIINGALIADGTAANPILLTSNSATPAKGDWGGIRHTSRFPLVLRHVTVEYGSLGVDYRINSEVAVNPVLEQSVVRYSSGTGVYVEGRGGANVTVQWTGNEVHDHDSYGLYLYNYDSSSVLTATVAGNAVHHNGAATGSWGIYVQNQGQLLQLTIRDNEVHHNGKSSGGGGIGSYWIPGCSARKS